MKMVTTKDDTIIMTVFYDTKGSLVFRLFFSLFFLVILHLLYFVCSMSDEVNSRLERLRDGLFDAFSSELGQVVRDNEALILDIADERKTVCESLSLSLSRSLSFTFFRFYVIAY